MKHARAACAGRWLALATTAVIVVPLGCSAGGGGVIPDAHPVDAYEVSLDLPPGCPPANGNEKQVGKPCTVTVNSNPDAGDLCATQPSSTCGSNASCCAYMTIGTYCVPNICLPGNECPVVGPPPP